MNKVDLFFFQGSPTSIAFLAYDYSVLYHFSEEHKSHSQKPAISWDDLRIRSVFALLVKKLRKIVRLKIEKFCKSI